MKKVLTVIMLLATIAASAQGEWKRLRRKPMN